MNLKNYLAEKNILLSCKVSKAKVLEELSDLVAESLDTDPGKLLDAVKRREELMSTGIGNGLAVPHVRLDGIKKAAIAVAVCKQGIADYKSMDSLPVNLVVFIVAPQGQHETYIRLLAAVAEILQQNESREAILAATEPGEVYDILTIGEN